MEESDRAFRVRSKVWIENDEGKVVLGYGRLKVFHIIQELGSIQAAAKQLGMSYRGLWGRIQATEARLGAPLLVRTVGGPSGGGTRLTPLATKLLEHFDQLNDDVQRHADRLFGKNLADDLEDL